MNFYTGLLSSLLVFSVSVSLRGAEGDPQHCEGGKCVVKKLTSVNGKVAGYTKLSPQAKSGKLQGAPIPKEATHYRLVIDKKSKTITVEYISVSPEGDVAEAPKNLGGQEAAPSSPPAPSVPEPPVLDAEPLNWQEYSVAREKHKKENIPLFVLITQTHCAFCKSFAKTLEAKSLREGLSKLSLTKVNLDEEGEFGERFIEFLVSNKLIASENLSTPTIVLFTKGEPIRVLEGEQSAQGVAQFLKGEVPAEGKPEVIVVGKACSAQELPRYRTEVESDGTLFIWSHHSNRWEKVKAEEAGNLKNYKVWDKNRPIPSILH